MYIDCGKGRGGGMLKLEERLAVSILVGPVICMNWVVYLFLTRSRVVKGLIPRIHIAKIKIQGI